MKPDHVGSALRRKISFIRTMRAVLWSFVGLRSRGESEKDVAQINPLHIVAAALIGVVVFVLSLTALATWVVGL